MPEPRSRFGLALLVVEIALLVVLVVILVALFVG
jgi:hypothetical protein